MGFGSESGDSGFGPGDYGGVGSGGMGPSDGGGFGGGASTGDQALDAAIDAALNDALGGLPGFGGGVGGGAPAGMGSAFSFGGVAKSIGNFFGDALNAAAAPVASLGNIAARSLKDAVEGVFGFSFDPKESTPTTASGVVSKAMSSYLDDPIQRHWAGMPPRAAESLPEHQAMSVLDGWSPGNPITAEQAKTLVGALKRSEENARGLAGQLLGVGVKAPYNTDDLIAGQMIGMVTAPMDAPLGFPISRALRVSAMNSMRTARVDRATIDPGLRSLGLTDDAINDAWGGYFATDGMMSTGEEGGSEGQPVESEHRTLSELQALSFYGHAVPVGEDEPPVESTLGGPVTPDPDSIYRRMRLEQMFEDAALKSELKLIEGIEDESDENFLTINIGGKR